MSWMRLFRIALRSDHVVNSTPWGNSGRLCCTNVRSRRRKRSGSGTCVRPARARAVAEPRAASFNATLCLAWPDGHDEVFEGVVHGRIVWPMRGSEGFGFDPIFLPDGKSETFGEMDPAAKHAMSHLGWTT